MGIQGSGALGTEAAPRVPGAGLLEAGPLERSSGWQHFPRGRMGEFFTTSVHPHDCKPVPLFSGPERFHRNPAQHGGHPERPVWRGFTTETRGAGGAEGASHRQEESRVNFWPQSFGLGHWRPAAAPPNFLPSSPPSFPPSTFLPASSLPFFLPSLLPSSHPSTHLFILLPSILPLTHPSI